MENSTSRPSAELTWSGLPRTGGGSPSPSHATTTNYCLTPPLEKRSEQAESVSSRQWTKLEYGKRLGTSWSPWPQSQALAATMSKICGEALSQSLSHDTRRAESALSQNTGQFYRKSGLKDLSLGRGSGKPLACFCRASALGADLHRHEACAMSIHNAGVSAPTGLLL